MREKRSNKPIIIATSIILAVLVLFIALVAAYPAIEAVYNRNSALKHFERAGGVDIIVVSDPAAYKDGVIPITATEVLEGEEMSEFTDKLLRVTEDSDYSETTVNMIGRPDVNAALRGDDGVYTIYFTEKQFYVTKDTKAFLFDIDEECLSDYAEFYNELYALTGQG